MIIRLYLKAVRTVAIPNLCLTKKYNFFLDSEWRPDNIAQSSERMHWSTENLLDIRELMDGLKSLFGWFQGIRLLLSGICAKSS